MTDSFASVWDAAGDDAEADQRLRALTSARVQVAPVWGFLAAAQTRQEFGHRFALVEDQVQAAAAERGVTFEVLAKSLADDFRALRTEGAYYVKDGDKEVGGPYDSKADAQDAIDGGDVSGDNLTVSGGGGDDSDDDGGDDDSDTDGDDSDSDEDADQAEGAPSSDGGDDDKDDDGGNPFAKKESAKKPEPLPVVKLAAGVVHQPGETVFVDHFMGHDEHEGRKGVWATVVKSPGQHPYADRAESHLLKPMAPGGTHFFHHFGGLQTQANDWWSSPEGQAHKTRIDNSRRAEFKSGVGSYDSPEAASEGGIHHSAWKPHRVYDSVSSALNHLSGGEFHGGHPEMSPQEHRDSAQGHRANLEGYNHCPSCDHVYSTNHPDHTGVGAKDTCPNCGHTDHHESLPDLLSENGHYDQHHERTTYDDDHGPDYHGMDGDNYGDPYGRHDQRHEASANCPECGHGAHGSQQCKGMKGLGACSCRVKKTALADGVDPLQWILETVPGGEGQAEAEAHHEGRTAAIVDRFRAVHAEFATE